MLNRILLILFLACCGECFTACASTNVVINGSNFQQAINSASSGDTLVVQSGIYNGNVSFDRSLTVVCSGGQIQLTGTTSVTNNATVSFSQTQFVGVVQAATNTTTILSQSACSNSVILSGGTFQAFDSQFQDLRATGGKVTVKRCNFASTLNMTSAAFEALRLSASGKITAAAPVGSGLRFVMVQSSIGVAWATGYQVYIAYSDAMGDSFTSGQSPDGTYSLLYFQDCDTVLIGNIVYQHCSTTGTDNAAVGSTRGTLKAYNNRLSEDGNIREYVAHYNGATGEMINNTLTGGADNLDSGVLVQQSLGPVILRNNIIDGNLNLESDSPATVPECSYSCIRTGTLINITGISCIYTSALFNSGGFSAVLSPANTWASLSSSSPCINTGSPLAIYNNTDGTRNTMGYTGGPLWNPANYTNNNPIMFFLNTTNQMVLKGVQSTVQINLGASAGH